MPTPRVGMAADILYVFPRILRALARLRVKFFFVSLCLCVFVVYSLVGIAQRRPTSTFGLRGLFGLLFKVRRRVVPFRFHCQAQVHHPAIEPRPR